MSSPATSPKNEHHCFYATLDPQSKQTYARSKTPYCDTVLLTSVRSIWMPKMSCWLLCVAVGLWATTCPAPTVVQALLSAGGAVGGLTVGRRCEDDWYGLPQDVANDRAAFAFSINFVGALVAVGATLCVQFLSGFDYGTVCCLYLAPGRNRRQTKALRAARHFERHTGRRNQREAAPARGRDAHATNKGCPT